MANTTSQVETWSSFYECNKEEIPTLQAAYEITFANYDTMTQALNQLGDELVLRTATLPHNFVILPGPTNQGKILLLHPCFAVSEPGERPILVGVNGNRYLSPFKAFDPNDATISLKPPAAAITEAPRISTRSRPIAPNDTRENPHSIPTLRQFLEVNDDNDFRGLVGDRNGQEIETLAEQWPTSFLLHPEAFACLGGAKEIRAHEAGLIIIKAIIEAYNPAEDASQKGSHSTDNGSDKEESHEAARKGPDLSDTAARCYRLLVFHWAIFNGMGTETEIGDPPESRIMDARMIHTRQELMPPIRQAPAQQSGGFASDPATLPVLVQNLNAMAEHALRSAKRDEHKTSMISRLSSDQSKLFTLLSAKDWRDYKPALSEFAKQLLADRDPFKAINLITSVTRAWRGTVGRRGITQFFCMGYAATDIETQPGGFTIFMFGPKNAAQPLSQAALKQSLHHLLGDTKVDDDTVLYFAQNDFYLPDSIDRLKVQLQTCIQFLDLITATKGIASEGYSEGLRLLRDDRQAFETIQAKDNRFSIKVAHLLDRVFQSFVNQLARYRSDPSPIRAAKRRLNNLQQDDVNEALRQIRFGIAPAIHLPASISDPTTPSPRHDEWTNQNDERNNRHEDRKKSASAPSERKAQKPESNSNIIGDWKVPNGKKIRRLLQPRQISREHQRLAQLPTSQHRQT
jgi:hypothetical protein